MTKVPDSYVQEQLQRVRDRMEVRGLKPITVTVYLRCLRRFIARVGKPLGTTTTRDVEQYLLELARQGVHGRTRNVVLAALRFAFRTRPGPNPTAGIRHGGLLAPGNVNGRLERAKTLLSRDDNPSAANADTADALPEPKQPGAADLPWSDLLRALTGIDLAVCPACHAAAMVPFPLPLPPGCRGPPLKALLN